MKSQKIRLLYGIFLSVLTIIVGITFIVQVADIYYGGPNPDRLHNYTVESVKEHLVLPLVFLCIWIAAIIGGFVLSLIYPTKQKTVAIRDERKSYLTLMKIMPNDNSPEMKNINSKLKTLERIRLFIFCLALVFGLTVALLTLTYALDPSHYSETQFLADMIDFLKNVLIYIGVAFVVFCLYILGEYILIKQEVDLFKKAIALKGTGKGIPNTTAESRMIATFISIAAISLVYILLSAIFGASPDKLILFALIALLIQILCFATGMYFKGYIKFSKKTSLKKYASINLLATRIIIGVVAITFIVVGVFNGGANDVLIKAIKICTECIGLG